MVTGSGLSAGFAPQSLTPPQRVVVQKVMEAALQAVDPAGAVAANLRLNGDVLWVGEIPYPLTAYRQILVVGAGKAAPAMARGLLDLLGDRVKRGILICKHLPSRDETPFPPGIICLRGNHPLPGQDSLESAAQLAAFLSECDAGTLIFNLLSGGGSALMTLPNDGISLADMQVMTRLLLACGAEIGEINTLRKHLDRLKGGGLARLASPARVVSLVLSDVVGSPLDVIASGPTASDPSTFSDALSIVAKYKLEAGMPQSILRVLKSGLHGDLPETLKPGDLRLSAVQNRVIAENSTAARATLEMAEKLGFKTNGLTSSLTGEARLVGVQLADILRSQQADRGQNRPLCLVAGGETTVTLRGNGLGGRNQEVALAAVEPLSGLADCALVTLATDGEDGPTGAAGAVATGKSLERARLLGLDPGVFLARNDSYHFFERMNDLIRIGPSGTNVNDLNFLFLF